MCDCKFDSNVTKITLSIPNGVCMQRKNRKVAVDQCIHKVIQELWRNGYTTLSSCCGHNGEKGKPNLVLSEYSFTEIFDIERLILTVDSRPFDLFIWKLTKVN